MNRTFAAIVMLSAATAAADSAGALSWSPPTTWKVDAPRPMRAATYQVPAAKGDTDGGEVGVFYFGNGQGGAVDANIARWVGQFENAKAPTPKKEKVNGLDVTSVELEGVYTGSGGPMGPKVNKPGYRLLGAIVEGPEGAVFFKFTGPAKTVDAAKGDFWKMVKSIKK